MDRCNGRHNKSEDCLQSIGDNTSALGWMRRSNFRQKDESDISWIVKQQLERKVANLILDSNTVLYKQWLKGQDNVIAGSLYLEIIFFYQLTLTLVFKNSL